MLNNTTKKCQILPNLVKYCRKFSQKPGLLKNIKKGFFSAKILIFFLQNPVSGPLKRHDGGPKFDQIDQIGPNF